MIQANDYCCSSLDFSPARIQDGTLEWKMSEWNDPSERIDDSRFEPCRGMLLRVM